MRRLVLILSPLLAAALVTTGCVSSKRYEQLEAAYASLQAGYDAAMRELDAMDSEVEELRGELEKEKTASAEELAKIQETYGALVEDLKDEISQGRVEVEQIKGKLQLTMAEEVFFDSGRAELKEEGKQLLSRIAVILKDIPEKNIRVEGHTDNVRIGKALREVYPSNWELGAVRAVNVVRYLEAETGIDPLRLSAVSYAQYRPVASNRSKSGRAKNRRIEIVLVERDLDLAEKMRKDL
ncbi:MAG: flagellar motor protein MotB [Spirochaetes bacterium]|nr:flagellar motor protein MotB [Spirochaetota bacterium]